MAFHQNYLSVEPPAEGQPIQEFRQTLKLIQETSVARLRLSSPKINRWENRYATLSLSAVRQIVLLNQLSESSNAWGDRGRTIRGTSLSSEEPKA